MLDLGRYLLGAAELILLTSFACLGAVSLRRRLLPDLTGAPSHLATAILALALLILVAELLGSFGLFEALPYLVLVGVLGVGLFTLLPRVAWGQGGRGRPRPQRPPAPMTGPAGRGVEVPTLIALAIAGLALVKFGMETRPHLGEGMTGFDTTWYHGPIAAAFFQSGDTWSLHQIAPQFLAWLYPANSEAFHAIGMLAFDRDIVSPLLNLGWLLGCLVACWCIGRPYGVAPWSLALGAVALSVPAFADQAGEARNDIVGAFFLLSAVAVMVNAWVGGGERGLPVGGALLSGLAAGLAAGTKLNFLLPAAVLVAGLALTVPRGARLRTLGIGVGAGLAGGGYWYLRNLLQTGNPLPWIDRIGPISLPAPDQALGGREGHSVLSYLLDGEVWSDWFLPGLVDGLWHIWPLLLGLMAAGLALCLERRAEALLRVASLAGLGVVAAWLIAPTSASGTEGMPRGFESGLRYLVPALTLGLALLPASPLLRDRPARLATRRPDDGRERRGGAESTAAASRLRRPAVAALGTVLVLVIAVGIGYPVQRHYLEGRYADPAFTAPGLNEAFRWARSISDSRIAATSTRQYPLLGTDLSNRVDFVGVERPHGGFVAPDDCRAWRRLVDEGRYDYVVASRDRIEPGRSRYPDSARWTETTNAELILREPPTAVFRLTGALDPSACR